jgi:tellurite methyltransferase
MSDLNLPLLDVRPEAGFLVAHPAGAVGIPLEQLAARVHELPARGKPLAITDSDLQRLSRGAEFLRERGHIVTEIAWQELVASESGPSRARLWEPNVFLVEALQEIRRANPARTGRAIDVACGTGRDAVFLAGEGYDVLAVDLLPDATQRAAELAARSGVSLATKVFDLEASASVPQGPFQLVTVFRYLHRPLFAALREATAPGGYVVYETFHERNLETGLRPRSPDHLLHTGELAAQFPDFEILIVRDAVERDGRYFSHLLARRPG